VYLYPAERAEVRGRNILVYLFPAERAENAEEIFWCIYIPQNSQKYPEIEIEKAYRS